MIVLYASSRAGSILSAAGVASTIADASDWEDLARRGLAALTRHHIGLAAPRRLIAFGRESALLADGCGVPTLAAPRLETLARSPAHKRRFWNAWLEWSA